VPAEPLFGDEVHTAAKEVLEVEREFHEVPERRLPRCELDQHIDIALRPVFAPGGRSEDADLLHAEPFTE